MKLFKILKPIKGKTLGEVVELNPDDMTVQTLLDGGYIEETKGVEEGITSKALAALTQSLTDSIAPAITKAMEEVTTVARKGIRIDPGEQQDDKTKSFADFLQCVGMTGVLNEPRRNLAAERLEKVYLAPPSMDFDQRYAKAHSAAPKTGPEGASYKAALAESSGITGGYTVPPEYSMRLLALAAEDTVLYGKTDNYTMAGRELIMPVLNQTTAPTAGNTAFFGGVVANWTAEAALRTETEPTFKEIRLIAKELSGYALASRNVIQDNAVALERRLTQMFAGVIGWTLDYSFLQGNGVGKPVGILGHPATKTVARTTTSTIKYADIVNMYAAMIPSCFKRAIWVIQNSSLPPILNMVDGAGNLIIQPYFPGGAAGGPAAVSPVGTILGRPVVVTEKVPALGSAGDLMLIDPMQYFSAQRMDVEIAASEHYKFLNNQVTYRFLYRGDGQPWLDNVVTLADATTTVAAFVSLLA